MKAAILTALLLAAMAPAAAAQDAAITRYCGGGFTGGGGGVMVDTAGRLHRLRQASWSAPRETLPLPGPAAPVARWQALLDAAGFESIPHGQRSNMTCSLTRRAYGRSHEVLWAGTGIPPHLPPELRQVIQEMDAVAR
ncbi:MAG TPA: hypothetical protein VGM87_10235 [Roseomonas sp.]